MNNKASSSFKFQLQRLVFLVRDHVPYDENDNDSMAYLEKVLAGTEGEEELINIRKKIKTSFQDVSCFFIYPVCRVRFV